MTDLWSVLLQGLTASGAALVLLGVKAIFRDKLSPRWQFGVWGVLLLALLWPAGLGGRYALVNWPLLVETLKTALTGDYGLTRVLFPIPLPLGLSAPRTVWDWLYLLYLAGALFLLARYALSYLLLRRALARGGPAGPERLSQLRRVAETYGLPLCRAVEVPGLSTAFVCGVLRPVLALPAGEPVDDKVVLHELLHLRHRDAAWGLLLCLLKCLWWWDPLLWYCMDRAGNDLESLCDQRVLERLEGEDRRDYGRILLSMASRKYARAPGTSSLSNGGKCISDRIQAIARFKRYPRGMALVSVCMAVLLALPLLGSAQGLVRATGIGAEDQTEFLTAMASARLTRCTTAAGALDAYAKAVLEENGIYRALCAPLSLHASLAGEMEAAASGPDPWVHEHWEPDLPGYPQRNYFLYGLAPVDGGYEALLVLPMQFIWGADGAPVYPPEWGNGCAAAQPLRAEEQDGRWVVLPLGGFTVYETGQSPDNLSWLYWGDESLPAAAVYRGEAENFQLEVQLQTVWTVDNEVQLDPAASFFGSGTGFDSTPKPAAVFEGVQLASFGEAVFTGDEAAKAELHHLGLSVAPMEEDGSRPALEEPSHGAGGGSGSDGGMWASRTLSSDWDGTLPLGGGSGGIDPDRVFPLPEGYAADLYVNGEPAASVVLERVEGGEGS